MHGRRRGCAIEELLGSRHHLRAFYGQLVTAGGTYSPIYIDQATFDAIVSSPKEQGGG